jgi:hypothetical protein
MDLCSWTTDIFLIKNLLYLHDTSFCADSVVSTLLIWMNVQLTAHNPPRLNSHQMVSNIMIATKYFAIGTKMEDD